MSKLSVEMVGDLTCSWCPIGYQNLKSAAEMLKEEIAIDISFLPFQINPGIADEGEDIIPNLMKKMRASEAQILAARTQLIAVGKEAGVLFDFSKRLKYFNTFKGHCLLAWAQKSGKHIILIEALHEAYFVEGQNLNEDAVLLSIVTKTGLDRVAAQAALTDETLIEAVKNQQETLLQSGMSGVPAFIIKS